ncbi:Cilia- and flagella-associated protein 57 [Eumeta japonica]|uniref:Cilia-and flagella-associated protein 57 n=1 Tax=Eumeta variegata TaxID=151549 RepID=A0A4C1YJ45_EUMVA|nr:Cilia- and flagella-associated protein 57 [Eumeta japonica]
MAITTAPNIAARIFYGLRIDIQYNAHYVSESEVLYPAGGVVVVHDHSLKKQRFIKLQDKSKAVKSLALAPNRRWLALNEVAEEGQKPTITVYDLNTCKRRKILTVPFENSTAREFACVQFTFDSKYLVAITGEPDWYLYYYNWDKGKVESHAKAQNPSGQGTITAVSCNPTDATLVVITGPYTFRIMNVSETVWRQWGWCKAENLNITSCMWLTPDRIMFGTSKGMLMLVENGEFRQNCVFRAAEVVEMSLRKVDTEFLSLYSQDMSSHNFQPKPKSSNLKPSSVLAQRGQAEETAEKRSISSKQDASSERLSDAELYPVTCLTNFPKGFAFACGQGYVHMFEKESLHHWQKRNLFRISRKSYKHTRDTPIWSPQDAIQHIAVDPHQENLLITTLRPQLYYVKLFGQHMLQNPEISFMELGPAMHYGRINSLSMCAWKPIFMTSGEQDRSLRVWNYMTDDVELIRLYQEEVHVVSLHPTGLFAVVGFSDKLRFLVILIDDFEVMREFPIRNCKCAKFSTNGQMFAAVNGKVVQVFSSVSFVNMFNLKGHNGEVTCLSWSASDSILVSCGNEGAVYEWSMSNGQRVGEIIIKTNQFYGCAINMAGKITYAVGSDGEIKELGSSSIRRQIKLIGRPLDTVALSRSDMMLFISGGEGSVVSVQLPLLDKALFKEFHVHNRRVTRLALSYDDQTLVSVAEDASICVWKLTNADGRAIALDKDFAYSKEILISKRDLQEKLNNMDLLATRLTELETEHAYQLRQTEALHAEKLKEIHEGYGAAIEELKEKNETMESEHAHEIGVIQQDISKMRANQEKSLQALETDFNIKLIGEYDRYQNLEDKTARMRKEYEERLEQLAESKRLALRDMSEMYENQVDEKDTAFNELQEQFNLAKREHETIKRCLEEDADREIIEIRTSYETQLKEEKDANVRLKGETGLMKKKLIVANKEIDEFKHQILQLKDEQVQFQGVISALEKDVSDLKKEISERDGTIQDKERRIYDLKRKKQELEKYKFVLNFKITELKNQIEPLERDLKEKKKRILELEESLEKLLHQISYRETKISQLDDKLVSAKKDYLNEAHRNLMMKNTLQKIKIDLHNITTYFQDPQKLKSSVKVLFHKYVEDIDFLRSRVAEDEALREFNRQRDHLEKQVVLLKNQLAKALGGTKSDVGRIMDENCVLLTEINNMRTDLKTARTRCWEMESILGLSARYVPPAVARRKLKHITENREKIQERFNEKLGEKEQTIEELKTENQKLLEKIKCAEVPDKDEYK